MRILQVIQRPQLRGAEIFASQLGIELIKLGHHVDFVYLFSKETFDLKFPLNYVPLNGNEKIRFFDFGAFARLAKIVSEGRYDIVQANAGDTLKYTVLSKLLFSWKCPLVYRNANKMSSFLRSRIQRKLTQFFLERTDWVISVSDNCRQDIIELFPKLTAKCSTGPIGTYKFDEIAPIEKNSSDGPVLINVGSFVPEKNHDFLIKVFSAYVNEEPNARLWLVGDGRLKEQLVRLTKELNIEGKVVFWGYRDNVISILKSADVMVMPSKIEGLPGVILEAFSCGVPVIASAVGGVPEVVVNEQTGLCLQQFVLKDYIYGLHQMVRDKEFRERVKSNGRRLAWERYDMVRIAQTFLQTYKKIQDV
jgi:L-malate glycosyltransferase